MDKLEWRMEMTKKVGNVDGFKRFYNEFVAQRMKGLSRQQKGDMAFLLMRGDAMTGVAPGVTVELRRMKDDEGNFIVQCADHAVELWPLFTELWQAYHGEWGEVERVPNPGVLARVRDFHRLRQAGNSLRKASKGSHCDPRTYADYCKRATGEHPI